MGYSNVHEFVPGIAGWVEAGYDVDRGAATRSVRPEERTGTATPASSPG